ncbi:MAG: ChbG/HpnK family deacetylase [Nanoarchaeota archaeon]|nr:ChbG/HpnK family deacetylase [Nanoarchaeota archaeon]
MTKYLIINADDFGMSRIFDNVILDLIKNNLVLSTTVMVNRITDNQKEQVERLIALSKNKNLSIGLHLEFENNDYTSQIKSQYQKFRKIFGFTPSHIDIHKAHSLKESFSETAELCKERSIPLRNSGVRFNGVKTTLSEAFFGSIEDFDKIEEWVKTFEDGNFYEILFHPGNYDPDCKSSLNQDRERDIKHIKRLNAILRKNNVKAVSYLDLAASR